MALFTSSREKRRWLWVLAVIAAIYGTLFMGQPLARELRDQDVQAVFFLIGMLLAATAVLIHGGRPETSRYELVVILGILAVYTMFVFRLGAPERSHLIEYSVLAIFIHRALSERARHRKPGLAPALLAVILASLVGILDEGIQWFLPNRVFDPEDMFFNIMAAGMAVGASSLLLWVRGKHKRKRKGG